MRRSGSALLVILGIALGGCTTAQMPSASSARALVRDYISAIDAHDGKRLCSMFTASVRKRLQLTFEGRSLRCEQLVRGFIGYADESGQPLWKHARLAGIDDVAVRSGHATVTFGVVHGIVEWNAGLVRNVVHPVRLEDRLELVADGGAWRIATSGATLAVAGVPLAKLQAPRIDTPEHAATDYLLALSGGPVRLCPVVVPGTYCQRPLPRWSSDDPSPLWQSAAVRRVARTPDGVAATIEETDVQGAPGAEHLVTRTRAVDLKTRRTAAGWIVDPEDPVSRHAFGRPAVAAPSVRAGRPLVLPRGINPGRIVPGRGDDAVLFFTRGSASTLLAASVKGTRIGPGSHVIRAARPRSDVRFAGDPVRGGAVLAWLDAAASSVKLLAQRVTASGLSAGPARVIASFPVGVPDSAPQEIDTLAVGRDGRILIGWVRIPSGSHGELEGVIADSPLRHPSRVRPLARSIGFTPVLAPARAGWLAATLLVDQPRIKVSLIASQRGQRHTRWPGVTHAKTLGSPALATTPTSALLVYAQGDRPAIVRAQPLTADGEPIGSPAALGRVPTAPARAVVVRAMVSGDGYRVAWVYGGDRRTAGSLTYVDVDAHGRVRSPRGVLPVQLAPLVDMPTPHLVVRQPLTRAPEAAGPRAQVIALP